MDKTTSPFNGATVCGAKVRRGVFVQQLENMFAPLAQNVAPLRFWTAVEPGRDGGGA